MDGSSAPWVYLIQDAGMKELPTPRRTIEILRPIQVQQGDKRMAAYPASGLKISYTISFDHPMLRHQQKTVELDEQAFIDQIAPARTFGFLKEVEMLRQRGLALGGSLENAIVLGETGVLNPLRFEDEFVRHKILDVIGDLALVGHPIAGAPGGASRRSRPAYRVRGRVAAAERRLAVRRSARAGRRTWPPSRAGEPAGRHELAGRFSAGRNGRQASSSCRLFCVCAGPFQPDRTERVSRVRPWAAGQARAQLGRSLVRGVQASLSSSVARLARRIMAASRSFS